MQANPRSVDLGDCPGARSLFAVDGSVRAAVAIGSALWSSLPFSTASSFPGVSVPAQPQHGQDIQQTAVTVSPLDAPLAILAEARQTYQTINDYTCSMISQERIKGKLEPEQVASSSSASNLLVCTCVGKNPREVAGQEVCYVQGRNNNKMRVHPTGAAGMLVS